MICKDGEYDHPIIKDVCASGYKEIFFLYEQILLEAKLTSEHYKKNQCINDAPIY
ncbi:hypothetical protein ABID39_001256 [Bartonella japonica]|uniref:Uncharacterized protein n=1 Tax=Bartonella japonica TaxID=357761 RepID=A0ABV2FPS1_9HYPH